MEWTEILLYCAVAGIGGLEGWRTWFRRRSSGRKGDDTLKVLAESVASLTEEIRKPQPESESQDDAPLTGRIAALERSMAQLEQDVLTHLRKAGRRLQAAREASGEVDNEDEEEASGEKWPQMDLPLPERSNGGLSLDEIRAIARNRR